MSDAPTIGLALIAKDEETALPALLASVQGAFDRIVLVDTGSTDKTVEVFEQWAQVEVAEKRLGSFLTDSFEWVDDFAAARRYAHALLGTTFESWADCDDVIVGAHNLRQLAAQAPEDLHAYVAGYNYAQDPQGNCVCYLKRERLVRAGAGRWEGRVHEAQVIEGTSAIVGPEVVEWVHRKDPAQVEPERNLRILEAWEAEEPENPRVLGYLGTEELARGDAEKAIGWFDRYLALEPGWDEERAQVHRKLAIAYGQQGREDEALATGLQAMLLLPSWPDSYLTLAEAHYRKGELGKAIYWADEVLRRGVPDTLLIVNPMDYSLGPLVVKAGALAQVPGHLAEAVALAEQVLETVPDHGLHDTYLQWKAQLKRESTAQSFVSAAQVLVEHDEQLKAAQVLDSVPHYAQDDPQVVAWRSMLRERLGPLFDPEGYREHYETGGTKPEDMTPDDRVMELGDTLPRCGFLLAGLREQA